ncbi:phosphate transporter (Pho88) [Coemansia sp. RSA 989]|nr:phosphate transporter (Pho88) [Coemansia sp. RSA 1821]KAJ1867550.1 phosphate transporter (Pho88) [Coemansia sp. RSA 989]KAJ1875808.1 phosphate transporter (Pho88) [Coemansia sp. RSA 990]KAJ2631780.1 phosphate transporter (Pho88) [Coemansia sp. RSA 1290]KAJ2650954.1 phosphate transporter (Pho88) [Coemansia sp. RSA 1250]KAJ2673558.1 phosphate transporter (Pho88) [Coemansia sp. RSA 1085]
MHVVKRAGLESPEYAPLIRGAYAVTTAIILGLTFYLKTQIRTRNDTTALEYDDPTPGSQQGRIVTTVAKYDLAEIAKLQKSTLFTAAIVVFMHFKFGYIQPLILQSLLPLLNLYKNPLFQIHVLGKPATDSLKRPWVPENPFAALTGANSSSSDSSNAAAAGSPPSAAGSESASSDHEESRKAR